MLTQGLAQWIHGETSLRRKKDENTQTGHVQKVRHVGSMEEKVKNPTPKGLYKIEKKMLKKILKDASMELLKDDSLMHHAFIAGGAVRSLIEGEPPQDYDIFLKDNSLVDKIRGSGVFTSPNAVTFYSGGHKIQIITNEFGKPSKIVGEFDFTMNMNYYCPTQKRIVVMHPHDIAARVLRINPRCRNKVGTLVRIQKFLARGYHLQDRMDLIRIAIEISKMPSIITIDDLVACSHLYFSEEDLKFMKKKRLVKVPIRRIRTNVGADGSSF